MPIIFDVTDEAGVAAVATTVSVALGSATLDGLVNNAGTSVKGLKPEVLSTAFHRALTESHPKRAIRSRPTHSNIF